MIRRNYSCTGNHFLEIAMNSQICVRERIQRYLEKSFHKKMRKWRRAHRIDNSRIAKIMSFKFVISTLARCLIRETVVLQTYSITRLSLITERGILLIRLILI